MSSPARLSSSKPKRPTRTELLRVRLSRAELAEAKTRAGNRSLSSILRAALLGVAPPPERLGRPPRAPMTEFEAARIRSLAWFGNNLNQIAHCANSGEKAPLILTALLRLERTMREGAFAEQTKPDAG